MTYVIRYAGLVGIAVHSSPVPVGAYLQAYDAEAYDGVGQAAWTAIPDRALRFDTYQDAIDCWSRVPRSRPLRDDGRPNRPLTAFSVSIERLAE